MIPTLVAAMSLGAPIDVTFKKVVVDTRFISEGVAVGHIDQDSRLDIIAGNVWFKAPNWTPTEIAPVDSIDPKTSYSNCFHTWTADLDHDGWLDQIVIGMPGEKAVWRRNPGPLGGNWREHLIWRSAGNESPLYEDLLGDGKKVLVMAYDDARLAWFEPAKDPYAEWVCHDVSELNGPGSQRYSHGLGVGDVDGDGRKDIVTTGGFYTAPKDRRTGQWSLTKAGLGPDCAQMLTVDVDGDKKVDVLSTSAHARGVWWHGQGTAGAFTRHVVDQTVSVTHAAVSAKIGGKTNLFSGKRKWGHPPGVDVGSDEPAWVMRYELIRSPGGVRWIRHVIDEDSGVGTQFVVRDIDGDGRLDIVTSNKNGVFLFMQEP